MGLPTGAPRKRRVLPPATLYDAFGVSSVPMTDD